MSREIFLTADGSRSIHVPELGVSFHSKFGAVTESRHVFIERGLHQLASEGGAIEILEMGMGTGLNVFLTYIEVEASRRPVKYYAVESCALEPSLASQLTYPDYLGRPELQEVFETIHTSPWDQFVCLAPWFELRKVGQELSQFLSGCCLSVNLIYYDAFDPVVQPALWTDQVFEYLYRLLKPGGRLVTYSSKGAVRRAMVKAGFLVKKCGGPPGKREISCALKPASDATEKPGHNSLD